MQLNIVEQPNANRAAYAGFEARIPECRKRIYALAYRILGNRSDAEDVVQEALVRAWSAWSECSSIRSYNGWINRVTTNLCLDRLRRRRSRREVSLDTSLSAEPDDVADSSNDPEKVVLAKEIDDRLKLGVRALPADYRECLLLFAGDLGYVEIAARLHCPV